MDDLKEYRIRVRGRRKSRILVIFISNYGCRSQYVTTKGLSLEVKSGEWTRGLFM